MSSYELFFLKVTLISGAAFGRAPEESPSGALCFSRLRACYRGAASGRDPRFFCFQVEDDRRFVNRVRNFRFLMLAGDDRPEAYLKK